jgi:hypothetical protein
MLKKSRRYSQSKTRSADDDLFLHAFEDVVFDPVPKIERITQPRRRVKFDLPGDDRGKFFEQVGILLENGFIETTHVHQYSSLLRLFARGQVSLHQAAFPVLARGFDGDSLAFHRGEFEQGFLDSPFDVERIGHFDSSARHRRGHRKRAGKRL